MRKTWPIARLGYYEYAVVKDTFEMIIPGDKNLLYGLEGSAKRNQAAWERDQRNASSASIAAAAGHVEQDANDTEKERN